MANPDKHTLEAMLKMAAGKLGTTPDALLKAAQNGDLSASLGKHAEINQLQQVLKDPEATKRLLETPEAKKLMQMLNQNKG